MKRYSEVRFGDILVIYWLDEKNHMGMTLIPAGMEGQVQDRPFALDGLVQLHARGDQLPNGYGNGWQPLQPRTAWALSARKG